MERSNRKSYLAPAPPTSLKESKESSSSTKSQSPARGQKHPSSKSSSRSATGEIPLNVARDIPSSQRQHVPNGPPHPSHVSQAAHYSSRPTRSPPPVSLEHLSLESKGDEHRPTRRPSRTPQGDTSSRLDTSLRPSLGSRSASSHNTNSRMPLQNTSLPFRAAPTPGGAPTPNQGNWQRRGDHMGAV